MEDLINKMLIDGNKITFQTDTIMNSILFEDFWYEYENQPISDVPSVILQIPFICNIAPVVWILGKKVQLEEMDHELFDSLKNIKSTLKTMFPRTNFDGEICVKRKVTLSEYKRKNSIITLFSGGLDSIATAFNHLNKDQTLLTVKGSDIQLTDSFGWEKVKKSNIIFGETYKFKNSFVQSNFHDFLNQKKLSTISKEIPNWWAYIQHGLALSSFMSIPAFINKSSNCYIASSRSIYHPHKIWGSCPEIDNKIKWASSTVTHDNFHLSRQMKIKKIIEKTKSNNLPFPYLRVCYEEKGGKNCCSCEKCSRTIVGLFVEDQNPVNFGFNITEKSFLENLQKAFLHRKFKFTKSTLYMWQEIQKEILSVDSSSLLYWLKSYDFNAYQKKAERKYILRAKISFVLIKFPKLNKFVRRIVKLR